MLNNICRYRHLLTPCESSVNVKLFFSAEAEHTQSAVQSKFIQTHCVSALDVSQLSDTVMRLAMGWNIVS